MTSWIVSGTRMSPAGRASVYVPLGPAERPCLLERPRDLLDEEGVALGLGGDQPHQGRRQRRDLQDGPGQRGALVRRQLLQRQAGERAAVSQGMGVPRPVGDDDEHRAAGDGVDERGQRRAGLLVHPVQVFYGQHQRPAATLFAQQCPERVEDPGAPRDRIHRGQCRIAGIDAEEVPQVRHGGARPGGPLGGLLPHALQDARLIVPLLDSERPLERVDDRQVGHRPPERDAASFHPAGALRLRGAAELQQQAGLPDPGLAGDEDDLPAAAPRLRQVPLEHAQLLLAADERGEAPARRRLEARARRRLAQHPVGGDRLAHALDRVRAERRAVDVLADGAVGALGQRDCPRLRQALQADGHVVRLADRGVVRAPAVADVADHDRAGVQSQAQPHPGFGRGGPRAGRRPVARRRAARRRRRGAEAAGAALDGERGQHRPARGVLVGDRGAEDGHEPVAEESGDRALVAVDLAERQVEETGQQGVHRLRAETRRERRRVGDFAAEHGDGAPFPRDGGAAAQALVGGEARRPGAGIDGRGRGRPGPRHRGRGRRPIGDGLESAGRGPDRTRAPGAGPLRGRLRRRHEAPQVVGCQAQRVRQAPGCAPLRALPAALQGLQGAHADLGPLGQRLLGQPGAQPVPAQQRSEGASRRRRRAPVPAGSSAAPDRLAQSHARHPPSSGRGPRRPAGSPARRPAAASGGEYRTRPTARRARRSAGRRPNRRVSPAGRRGRGPLQRADYECARPAQVRRAQDGA